MACVVSAPVPICATCELPGAPIRAAARVRSFSVQASRMASEAGADKNTDRDAHKTQHLPDFSEA